MCYGLIIAGLSTNFDEEEESFCGVQKMAILERMEIQVVIGFVSKLLSFGVI